MYFLHEHPAGATSWKDDLIGRLLRDSRVYSVEGDMCQFNMKQKVNGDLEFVKKRTRFMTNAEAIAARLGRKCIGRS